MTTGGKLTVAAYFNYQWPLELEFAPHTLANCPKMWDHLRTVLPYSALAVWGLETGGLDLGAMVAEIARSRISTMAWLDVLVSAVVLIAFIRHENRRLSIAGWWIPIAGTCAVGVSLGLPLFLLMRERKLRRASIPDTHKTVLPANE